jgi:hypothetical protein
MFVGTASLLYSSSNNALGAFHREPAHSLTHDRLRYFGLMEIQNGVIHRDYAWVLGLRNSHDKTFLAGIVAGANVLPAIT